MSLPTEAAALWALSPQEFVSARAALVRALRGEGRRDEAAAVAKLRKPTRDAWVVNRLVAREPELVRAIVAVGERLRAAQVQRKAPELRALAADRDGVIDAALAAAGRITGPLSPAVAEAVRGTLLAAMADPQSASQVEAGALTHGLRYAGLGAAPLASVVSSDGPAPAGPARAGLAPTASARPEPRPDPASARALAAAKAALRAAEDDLTGAQLAGAAAQQQVDELAGELADARAALREAQSQVRALSRARDAAARRLSLLESRQQ